MSEHRIPVPTLASCSEPVGGYPPMWMSILTMLVWIVAAALWAYVWLR